MGTGAYGYRYVLTIIDHFSRFTKFYKLKTRNTEEVSRNFQDFLYDFGVPDVVILDNAREFTANQFRELCLGCNIQLGYTTPYHPQGNSLTERMHHTMKCVLANLCKGQPTRWPNHLKECQRVINSAVHEATGVQPHFAFFGRHAPRLISARLPDISDDTDPSVAHTVIKETNKEMSRKWRDKANLKRMNKTVDVNDLVWVKREQYEPGTNRKLSTKWKGPYKVLESRRDGNTYVLENVFDGTKIQRASDEVKKYMSKDRVLVEPEEIVVLEEEEEVIPPRERRPPRRYV